MRARVWAALLVVGLLLVAAPASAQAATFPFSVDRIWLAGGERVAVVGTYSCGPFAANVGTVDLTVRQGGRTGYGYATIDVCDGRSRQYEAEVTSVDGQPFTAGPATVAASGYVCALSGSPCQTTSVPQRSKAISQLPPTFAFSLDGARRGADPATVTVNGTYTCGLFVSNIGTVDLSITQGTGSAEVNGSGFASITVCNGKRQRYTATVQSNDGRPFTTGAATAQAGGYVNSVTGLLAQTTQLGPQAITVRRPG